MFLYMLNLYIEKLTQSVWTNKDVAVVMTKIKP